MSNQRTSGCSRGRSGYVILAVAMAGVCVCAFAGLAVDAGFAYHRRALAQTAADAGALAAAAELGVGGDYESAGLRAARMNGFTHGVDTVSVRVNRPVTSGALAGSSEAVEVTVAHNRGMFFARIVGMENMNIRARSVARLGDGGACIYALNPSAPAAFKTWGNATVTVNCGIVVNSASGSAISVGGSSCVTADQFAAVGGAAVTSGCPPTPMPNTGIDPFADPLESVSAPPVGSCNFVSFNAGRGPVTLVPGVYCGGIKLASTSVATMSPGIYVLLGGGLIVQGGGTLSGSGVMFYNTFDGAYAYTPLSFSGGSSISLSAPVSGTYKGILFFEDRNAPTGQTHYLTGDATTRFEGSVYLSRNGLKYSGGASGISPCTIIVADTVEFTGNTYFESNYTAITDGSPVKSIAKLVE